MKNPYGKVTAGDAIAELKHIKANKNNLSDIYEDVHVDVVHTILEVSSLLPGGRIESEPVVSLVERIRKIKIVEEKCSNTRINPFCEGCPECEAEFVKQNVMPNRKCRHCDRILSGDRYYSCTKCLTRLPEDIGDAVYCGSGEGPCKKKRK